MTNSEKKYYNKKFMPPYMQKWNIAMIVMVAVWFVGFVAAFLVSALVVPEQNLTGKIAIVFLLVMLVLAIVLIAGQVTFNKKLIKQRKEELEKEYTPMGFEEAKAALIARGVITENGIVIPSMAGGSEVVPNLPFKDVKVYLFSASVGTKILTVVSFCNQSGAVMAEYLVDKELYNYLQSAGFDIVYYGGSNMLFGDKGVFVKKVMKTRNSKGMGYAFIGGAVGAALAQQAKDETPEMDAVLRVLRRENI